MSNFGTRLPRRRTRYSSQRKAKTTSRWVWASLAVVGVVIVALLILATRLGGGSSSESQAITAAPDAESLRVGAIEAFPARFELGDQPINKWVNPTFKLKNVGDKTMTVTLASGSVKVLEGCCAPVPVAGSATDGNTIVMNNMNGTPLKQPVTKTIKPGEEIYVRLELQMMTGMDGPHLLQMTVPVTGEDGQKQQPLELYVKAHFGAHPGGDDHQH